MIDDVRRAQAADRAAFRRLVERFRGMAVGDAVGWVGDAAEDVAQEAFVEAFLHLSELRDAAAFPGWLQLPKPPSSLRRSFETGIKAIDLLAPLEQGMIVRIHGPAGTGLTVLLAELTSRFEGAVWNVLARAWEHRDLQAFADSGVQPQFGGDFTGRPLFLLLEQGRQAELEAQLPRLRQAQIAFVVDPWREATLDRRPPLLAPPYDALVMTDPVLAEAGIYPAIDRELTRSTARLAPEHARIADAVRRLRTRSSASSPSGLPSISTAPVRRGNFSLSRRRWLALRSAWDARSPRSPRSAKGRSRCLRPRSSAKHAATMRRPEPAAARSPAQRNRATLDTGARASR